MTAQIENRQRRPRTSDHRQPNGVLGLSCKSDKRTPTLPYRCNKQIIFSWRHYPNFRLVPTMVPILATSGWMQALGIVRSKVLQKRCLLHVHTSQNARALHGYVGKLGLPSKRNIPEDNADAGSCPILPKSREAHGGHSHPDCI